MRAGNGSNKNPGLESSWRKHGGVGKSNKSQFTIPKEEVRMMIQEKVVIQSPVKIDPARMGPDPKKWSFVREVDLGRTIGNLPSQFVGDRSTSIITIITDYKGNLTNVYPGPFKY